MKIDPELVMREAQVDPKVFENPDNRLSFSARARLLSVCANRSSCPHFGLRVGQAGSLSTFGLVGYLSMHADRVEEALQSLARYLHLHGQGGACDLECHGNRAFFYYEIVQRVDRGADQLEDAAIAIACNMLRELCGKNWGPIEVWFTHRRPSDIRPYKEHFQAPLRFDMPQAGIHFSARWLGRAVKAADPELHRLLQLQIDQLEDRYREDFSEQVSQVLPHALLTRSATAEQVAALFSIHSRTLHRRLKSNGTSFRELVRASRYALARQLLETSDAPMAQVAETIGYADARVFSRAFKRWSGVSPARWRKDNSPPQIIDPAE